VGRWGVAQDGLHSGCNEGRHTGDMYRESPVRLGRELEEEGSVDMGQSLTDHL